MSSDSNDEYRAGPHRHRSFVAFFTTQLLGTLNDQLVRNALLAAVAYQSVAVHRTSLQAAMALSALLFVLPYFLFSPLAGELGDRLSKSHLIRLLKLVELAVAALMALGFAFAAFPAILIALFLMGTQSTLFEAVKYSIVPELVGHRALTGANGLVSAGTFASILVGTAAGGLLGRAHLDLVTLGTVAIAVLGAAASFAIGKTAPVEPALGHTLNPLVATRELFRALRENRTVFLSALGVAWLWFLGGSFLTLLPSFGIDALGGTGELALLFLSVFCVGVALGSLLCAPLGGGKLELGLVPLGSIGLALASLDLFFASQPFHAASPSLLSVEAFLAEPGSMRLLVDVFVLASFGGLFSVPLYTLIQIRSPAARRSRVVAASNMLNALFLCLSSMMLLGLPRLEITIAQTFLILAALSALVSIHIYTVIPEFLLRFIAWLLAHLLYRIRIVGREHLPDEGPVILAANHTTYVDWLVISSIYQRPLRFVMHQDFLSLPLVGWAFRDAKVIPIASRRENPEVMERAFARIAEELEDGSAVCIFPEGELTRDGELGEIRPGILKALTTPPVPVVPIRLDGLWGSFFSRKDNLALRKPFRRVWSRVTVTVHPPLPPDEVTQEALRRYLDAPEGSG